MSASVEVIPASDLTISVSDGTDTIAPGASDTYTITLTNNGPSPATNATVSDTLDGGFIALSAVSSIGGTSLVELAPDQFAWTGINLASGASATFSIMGNMSTGLTAGSAFVNLANVSLDLGQVDTDASSSAVDSDSVIFAPQAINFTPPTVGIAGTSDTLSATGGASGNPVVFSVDPSSGAGVCSVSGIDGTTLSYVEAGTCVIDANQAGNASYAAAPTVTGDITVDQTPTFTLDAPPTAATVGQSYAYTFAASGVPTPTFSLGTGVAVVADARCNDRRPERLTAGRYDVLHLLGHRRQRRRERHCRPFAVTVSSTRRRRPTRTSRLRSRARRRCRCGRSAAAR